MIYVFERREDKYKITEFGFDESGIVYIRTKDKRTQNITDWIICH
jgi:hypothetical protein